MATMTVTLPNGDPIDRYSSADEGLHTPGPEENWQESVAIIRCRDFKHNINIFQRFGHEPVMDGGNMTLWAFLQTPELDFMRCEQFVKKPDDVIGNRMSAGGVATFEFDGERLHWTYDDGNIAWNLHLTPMHQPIPSSPDDGEDYRKHIGKLHHENSDRFTGTVRIAGKSTEISGITHRDHSWGPRNWHAIRVHRWSCGSIGEDFSYALGNMLSDTLSINRRGYIRLGSKIHYTNDVDIVPIMEADGITIRRALINAGLEDGRRFEIELIPYGKAPVNRKRNTFLFDCPCEIRYDGKVGDGFIEVVENHRRGTGPIDFLINGYLEDGIYTK